MLKIRSEAWRGWARLATKALFVSGSIYLVFGVLFGVARGVGASDGKIILYCRVCGRYVAGDVLLMSDGRCVEYGNGDGGMVAGKVIAQLGVRNFTYEISE
ncbi:MAG: hypothetical protein K5837_02690 [Candidatus Saccharibacteria bacterium]|nr:hypothetical protein [Candidatus Saccharibacteria bacterium]